MTLKIPNAGEFELIKCMLNGAPAQPLVIKLYVNNVTPTDLDIAETYVEMSSHGYASKTLSPEGWTFARLSTVSEATHTKQTWDFTTGVTTPVYGYYVVGAVDGIIRWAERLYPTFSAELVGDSLSITPKLTFSGY